MKIEKIEIQNFRCFENNIFSFNPNMTVLIGDNGSGKTAILDALSLVLSEFIKGFSDIDKSKLPILSKQDKRYVLLEMGQTRIKQSPFDILLIEANITINDNIEICTISDSPMIFDNPHLALNYAKNIMEQDAFLPFIGYYPTDRLCKKKKKNNNEIETLPPSSRLFGYKNCLQTSIELEQIFSWFKTQELIALEEKQEIHILEAVRNAIINMIPEAKNVYWSTKEGGLIVKVQIQGKIQSLPFHLLSDGYRIMIAMVADIAYRMATLNPQLEKNVIKETEGIVLIDEIDLHLHPKWQKIVVERLSNTFPKVQFIATTHSPFIVQSLKANEIINLDRNQLSEDPEKLSLEENALYMGVQDSRSDKFVRKGKIAEEYLNLLNTNNNDEALLITLDELLSEFGDDPVFIAKLKLERLAKLGR
ncbi:hypothetical protein DOJK_01220 [Patescibacteria group bacterium]|nr:hypothetical protein DOJK_01220 [Patescibacteria group bacterium]